MTLWEAFCSGFATNCFCPTLASQLGARAFMNCPIAFLVPVPPPRFVPGPFQGCWRCKETVVRVSPTSSLLYESSGTFLKAGILGVGRSVDVTAKKKKNKKTNRDKLPRVC